MNWKYIKWLLNQPKVKLIHRTYLGWRGYCDSVEIYIGRKLMYSFYKHPEKNSEIRYNWIERL